MRSTDRQLSRPKAQDVAQVEWRQQIERGWLQAQAGIAVDGPAAMVEIKDRLKNGPRGAIGEGKD